MGIWRFLRTRTPYQWALIALLVGPIILRLAGIPLSENAANIWIVLLLIFAFGGSRSHHP